MMDGFSYRGHALHVGDIPVADIAETVGTPTYIYSADGIRGAYSRLQRAFAPLGARLHYAVKASPNMHLCRLLRELGAGMDVVSGGEMERAWLSGSAMDDIVFAGVGKTDAEIYAALDGRFSPVREDAARFGRENVDQRGPVGMFNIESPSELDRLAVISKELGIPARACIRVNPDVDARTHVYTTTGKVENKFGIDFDRVTALFDRYRDHPTLRIVGLHAHIGSPVRHIDPYESAIRLLLGLIDDLEAHGHAITVLDIGGGWAIDYYEGESPGAAAYAEALVPLLEERVRAGLQITMEPGRSIVGNAGILLTRVHHIKEGRTKRFVICDAGMHTLIRPALYQAFHFLWPVQVHSEHVPTTWGEHMDMPHLLPCDVVGPICESSDFLAKNRALPEVERGDLLAVFSAGAYGMSITSNYNDHGRPAEVLVDGDTVRLINQRQKLTDVLETERMAEGVVSPG